MAATYADLQHRLQESELHLKTQLDHLKNDIQIDIASHSNHLADLGTAAFEQARDNALMQQLSHKYDDVRVALEKFDKGTYGWCECCNERIPLARLDALPSARHCMDCQCHKEAQA